MQNIILTHPSLVLSRKILGLSAALFLLGAAAWANNDPWKSKPYAQWDDKDLQRVFTDSPWARTVLLTRTWLPLSARDFPEQPINGATRKLPSRLEQSDEATLGADVTFDVYWASSRVMRAALARQAVLHGGNSDLDVAKYANGPQEEYQIVLQSADMAPFVRHDEKFYQANAFLGIRNTKLKISPSHVVYEHGEDPRIVTAAVFFFPKKTPSGDPTIAPNERNVEFSCKVEGSTLRVNFDPSKMVDQFGPAL